MVTFYKADPSISPTIIPRYSSTDAMIAKQSAICAFSRESVRKGWRMDIC